ncbi:MAG: hypothetical protein ABIW30_02730 [Arenimonas sp.]
MKRGERRDPLRLQAQRQRVAFEAARLIAQHGLQDYHQAKLRAAHRLGFTDAAALPGNAEVLVELRDYQRLFQGEEQPRQLRLRREAAVPAMQFFECFEPRLVGSVLEGSADGNSPVSLQLFCDDADEVARLLLDSHLRASAEPGHKLRIDRKRVENFPHWSFFADGIPFELTVLPTALLRNAPLSPIDGKPMQRASLVTLRELLTGP